MYFQRWFTSALSDAANGYLLRPLPMRCDEILRYEASNQHEGRCVRAGTFRGSCRGSSVEDFLGGGGSTPTRHHAREIILGRQLFYSSSIGWPFQEDNFYYLLLPTLIEY